MGKAKGTGKGKGGFFGAFEAIGQIANCLFCMMCLGPILLIAGFYVMSLAAADNRGKLIEEYDSAVQKWNNGPGSSGEFKGYGISAKFVKGGQVPTTVLLGAVAPEPLGDQSLRTSEAFFDVNDPWYYSTENDDKTINTVYPNYDGGRNFINTFNKGSKISLTFFQHEFQISHPTDFYPVVAFDTPYSWYCSSSSSSGRRRRSSRSSNSCSSTCKNPNDSYNSNSAKSECDDWCEGIGGTWYDNGKCYDSHSSSATGCCHVYYGARDACFTSKVSNGEVTVSKEACAVANDVKVKSEDGAILYGAMNSKSSWGAGMKISIRHELDPYIQASRLTAGCSSGTSGSMDYMAGFSAPSGSSSQCFGLTPEELMGIAQTLLFFGVCFSSVPCLVLYCLVKKSKNNNNNNNNNNGFQQPQVIMKPHQQQYQAQPGQQQYQAQPGQQQYQAQPGQQYQAQPVQPVYIQQPQPVQQVYQPQYQPTVQPVPVQPVPVQQPQYIAQAQAIPVQIPQGGAQFANK